MGRHVGRKGRLWTAPAVLCAALTLSACGIGRFETASPTLSGTPAKPNRTVAHTPALRGWDMAEMSACGIRFGKALQLTNVLRDCPKDLRIGRCYLPVSDPHALLKPENFPAISDLYHHWLDVAAEHLDAGWQYTMHLPRRRARLRIASSGATRGDRIGSTICSSAT